MQINLGDIQVGQTVHLRVDFATSDGSGELTGQEIEPLIITGPGFIQSITKYGSGQDVPVTATEQGEKLTAYIEGADNDETASIQAPQVFKIDMYSFIPSAKAPVPALQLAPALNISVSGNNHGTGLHDYIDDRSDYRTAQQFYVLVDAQNGQPALLPDPAHKNQSGTALIELNLAGTTQQFINGQRPFAANPPAFQGSVQATQSGNHSVRIHLQGSAADLFPGMPVPTTPVRWDTTINLQTSADGSKASYVVQGTVPNYPATQVDINDQTAAANFPGNGPLNISQIDFGLSHSTLISAKGPVPGGDPLVVTTQPPSTVTAGEPFGLVVTAQNDDGSVNTAFNGAVSVASDFGNTLGGTLTATAVNGVATFAGLTEDVAGSDELVATANGLPAVDTDSFNVAAAPATKFVLTAPPPAKVTAGATFGIEVSAEDPFGNVDPNFNGTATLTLTNNPSSGTLGGSVTATAANGIAAFSGLTINKPGSGYTVQASSTGLSAATSGAIDVTPLGVATQLVVTAQPPSSVTAGSSFAFTVSAEDSFGTVDTAFNGTVSVASDFGNILGGTLTATAVNGVATFSGLTDDVAGSDKLVATGSGLPAGFTDSFNVTGATATHLVLAPLSGVVAAKSFVLSVSAEDPFGNVDPNYTGSVTVALASNPGGATLGRTLTVNAVAGVADFSDLTLDKLASGYAITATSPGLGSVTSPSFDVSDKLAVTTSPPNSVVAGSGFGLTVSVEDGTGSVDTNFNGPVSVALSNFSSGPSSLGGTLTVNAVQGVATFSGLTVNQAGSYGLSISGNNLLTAAASFSVIPASASQLVVTSQPVSVTAGAGFGLTIAAEDRFGDVDSSFRGGVTLALTGGSGTATLGGTVTATAANGIATFSGLTIDNAGSGYILQASSGGVTSAATTGIDVKLPGVATQLVVTAQPPGTVAAGGPFGLTIAAEDGFGTVDTSFSGTVTLDADNAIVGLGGTLIATAKNGVASFAGLTLDVSGSYTLSASSSGLADTTTNAVNAAAAAATTLTVSNPISPSSSAAILSNSPLTIQVNATDPFGNIDTTYNGTVTVALGQNPGSASLGGTLTGHAVNGIATFSNLKIDKPGSGYTLQATAAGLSSGTSSPFDVSNDQLVVTTEPPTSVSAGNGFGLVVSAEDASGAVDSSFQGNVTVALSGLGGGNSTLGGTVTVAAVNGVATFSALTVDQVGSDELTVSSPGLATATTATFQVSAAAASKLVATTQPPASVTVGAGFEVDVTAEDPNGNVDTNFNGSVALAVASNPASGTLGGTLTETAVDGAATFKGLTINVAGNGYTLQATSTGVAAATTSPIDVTPLGAATQLVATSQPPSNVTAGSGFGLAVKAEDSFGTIDASFNGNVTATLVNENGSGVLDGTSTVTAVNGVASFSGLTIGQPGSYSLTVTGSGLSATTNTFNVTAAAATQLDIAGPSSAVLSNSPFGLVVDALDPNGNLDQSFNGAITVTLMNNPSGAQLGGTLTLSAVDGVADFPGITISSPGNGYTLQATATGLNAASTLPFDVTKDQLVFTTDARSNVAAGNGFGIVVSAEDGSGAVDTSFQGDVTVALSDLEGVSGNLGGTVTAAAVNGVATFSALTIDQVGSYVLTVSSSGLAPATSGTIQVNAAPASKLVATTEPPQSVTVGAGFEVDVTAQDPNGNVDTNFNGSVTLALASNPVSGTLGGTLTGTAVNGVATFKGLTINAAGSGYTLQATSTGLAAAATSAIDITPLGAATQLVVTVQPPSSIAAGSGFGMSVTAEDSFGTIDASFDGPVTIALSSLGSASGTLTGAVTAVAKQGVATFSGLAVAQAGTYSLTLTNSGLAGATTQSFNVNPTSATHILVLGPGNVAPGSSFDLSTVAVDANGNVDTAFSGPITVALGSNPAASTFGGTLTLTAVNGVANFSGLSINNPGSGYTIQATGTGLTAGTSSPFSVSNDQLVLTVQPPANVGLGSSFGLTVAAEGSSGNVDASFNGGVTATLVALAQPDSYALLLNNGALGTTTTDAVSVAGTALALGGTTTVNAVNGVATFSGLKIAQAAVITSSVGALPVIEASANFTVSWSGSETGGPGVASYNVFVSDNGGAFTAFKTDTSATSATFTGVNGHTYGFYSVATDTAGNVQPTPTVAQATTTLSIPVLPTSSVSTLPTTENSTSFTVSWSGSDVGGPGIAGFDVFVRDNGGAFTAFKTDTSATSATFSGVNGHTYGFYSVAIDTAGNRQTTPIAAQATTTLSIPVVLPTSSVSTLPATETSTSFTVSWSGSDTGGPGIASYSVFVSDNGGAFTAFKTDTSATSATFTGVVGHKYGFYSVATDTAGKVQTTPTAAQATTTVSSSSSLSLKEDIYVIGSGTITVSAADGVLANDTGPTQLTVTSGTVTGAEGGTFVFHSDGSFTYTPPSTFPGFDYAKYTAQDASGDQGTATVNVLSQQGGLVWKFYEQALQSDPDYARLQSWINDLSRGGTPGDIAAGLFENTEQLNPIITSYYQQYLGRAPQGNDLAGWETVWRQTGGPEGIKASFVSSPEFNALAGNAMGKNPAGLITALYEHVLNRGPVGNDLPFWEQKLGSGTSGYQVALDFVSSLEAFDNDVTGWFYEYLGRAPTLTEQAQYAKQLIAGATDQDIEQAISNLPDYAASPAASPAGAGVRLPDYLPTLTASAEQTGAVGAKDSVFSELGR